VRSVTISFLAVGLLARNNEPAADSRRRPSNALAFTRERPSAAVVVQRLVGQPTPMAVLQRRFPRFGFAGRRNEPPGVAFRIVVAPPSLGLTLLRRNFSAGLRQERASFLPHLAVGSVLPGSRGLSEALQAKLVG
jgi:hypothetical protein